MRHRPNVLPRTRQGWFGASLLVSMMGLAAMASRLPPPQFEPVGGRLLAITIPLVLSALGLILMLRDMQGSSVRPVDEGEGWTFAAPLRPAVLYALLFLYTFVVSTGLNRLVYIGVSCVFAALAGWLIAESPRIRHAIVAAIVGLLLSAGIMWSFSTMLYVDIAR